MPSFDDTFLDEDSHLGDSLPSVMPSMDDVDKSLASLQPHALTIPDIEDEEDNKSGTSSVHVVEEDLLSRELDQEMHFDPKHYRNSSDSSENGEEDKNLTEGLSFPDVQSPSQNQNEAEVPSGAAAHTVTAVKQTVSTLMTSTISGLGKLSQSVLGAAASSVGTLTSSDEQKVENKNVQDGATGGSLDLVRKTSDDSDLADFEMLSQEDLDNFENSQVERKNR